MSLRWPFIQALVRRNRSASSKALYNAPAEAFVHCTGPAPRTPYSTPPALLYRRHSLIRLFRFVLLRFFSLSCNCSLTTDELSCMSTGATTVAPELLQRRRQPAQTQLQHEHHRRSLAIKYGNDTHMPPRIRYYYPTASAYVHFPSISTAPLNFFRASFSFS